MIAASEIVGVRPRRGGSLVGIRAIVWWIVVAAALPSPAAEADATTLASDKPHPPYCGVYSLFGAFHALGKDVKFESLLQPRYIGSKKGSSAEELRQAAEDHGLHAVVLTGLSDATLDRADTPVILHVVGKGPLAGFTHWVLFLGLEGDLARVVDAPDPPRLVPISRLLASWDGTALIVSTHPLSVRKLMVPEHWALLNYALLTAGVALVAHALLRKRTRRSGDDGRGTTSAIVQGAGLLGAAVVLAIVVHLISPVGFLRHPDAVSLVVARNLTSFFPKVSVAEARDIVRQGDTLIVDARFSRDFNAGHLPGAVNIPVDSTADLREAVMRDVPGDRPILVYCQSKNCRFDETIALTLAQEGYLNIRLFAGGWSEWKRSGNAHD